MRTKASRPLAAAALVVSGAAALAALAIPALAQTLPEGNGKELVATICTSCHDLSPIMEGGGSKEDWNTVIQSMIQMGADIKPDQAVILVNYLATNFPPKPQQ
jgi:cytochrome c5